MRNLILVAAAAAAVRCFGIAASQAWVTNYVANYVAGTASEVQAGTTVAVSNGCTVATANAGRADEMRLVIEGFSDAALMATNCQGAAVAASVTNGTLFVWDGAGAYANPAGKVAATRTNLVWRGVGSVATNRLERFAGWFDARGVLIQPHTSFAVTNGMTEAGR